MQENSTKSKKQMPIAVYVRQRPQSKQEIEEREPCVLEIPIDSRLILVKHRTCQKDYQFDEVFRPDCSQMHIYYRVLEPLITEVLQGYNCTVFAYGQTGTGKTHTIIGKLDSFSGDLVENSEAGLITRAATHIFTELNRAAIQEYTVRVSFVELYNEELKDLLRDDNNDVTPLRLYEDPRRKGSVIVQNLSEKTVCSAEEIHEMLIKGMEKRHTATTFLNDYSSRSHCVFTINVYMKEFLVHGVETVKSGKLNLVDLAGSENISRSGAMNTRAREAGNINQSLLTLGRVIKALSEHQAHIPYRESKLTRILQDSLGGKTKTAIIATVSPSLACLDETISTLDYANRACRIVNCPEVNKNSSKTQLIDMLTKKIESARKDIAALRQGSGFYVDADNYQSLLTEKEEKEKQILNKQETISEIENYIKELSKIKTSELQRWTELMESFNFTRRKSEEYKQKGLKVKAEAKILSRLIKESSEEAKHTASKNKNIQMFLESRDSIINQLQTELNSYYSESEKREAVKMRLSTISQCAVDTIKKIIQTTNNELETKSKATTFQNVLRCSIEKASDEQLNEAALNIDLKAKEEEILNIFGYEKSACVDYSNLTQNIVKETQSFNKNFFKRLCESTVNTTAEFNQQMELEQHRKIDSYKIISNNLEEMKNQHLQVTSNGLADFKNKFTQLNDSISNKLDSLIKCQKRIEIIKRELQNVEHRIKNKFDLYNAIAEKANDTIRNMDTVFESATETPIKIGVQLENFNPSNDTEKIIAYVDQSDINVHEIVNKYEHDMRQIQSNFELQVPQLQNKLNTEVNTTIEQHIGNIHQQSLQIKELVQSLQALINDTSKNQNEKLTAINSYILQLAEQSANLDYRNPAKQIYENFSNLEENVCVSDFRKKWTKVQPTGDTPNKQKYKYNNSLIDFSTPVTAKNINLNDSSFLDVSVGSVDISLAQPEDVEDLEKILQQENISTSESASIIEYSTEDSSQSTSDT